MTYTAPLCGVEFVVTNEGREKRAQRESCLKGVRSLSVNDSRKYCEFIGFTENHENESILIFHFCSTNINLNTDDPGQCRERHIGNTPRSIMTKGNSVAIGTRYGNFIKGNRDKLMITYRRERSHDYTMFEACGVMFEGEIHFFGGYNYTNDNGTDLSRQHFVIETKRSDQLVKMTKKNDLEQGVSRLLIFFLGNFFKYLFHCKKTRTIGYFR